MLTISLDEYGAFEESVTDDIRLIGGYLFDDRGDETEKERERRRIDKYYRMVADAYCTEEVQLKYPQSLHVRNGVLESSRCFVALMKNGVKETLPEFIQKGTFRGAEIPNFRSRKGIYKLFICICGRQGKKNRLDEDTSILIRDSYASNLYFHMASLTVRRLIFHNPDYLSIPDISFILPSRTTPDLEGEKLQEYKSIDASKNKNAPAYTVMNNDIYRTIIQEEMRSQSKENIRIGGFSVTPIRYSVASSYEPEQPFLYLSDSICSFLTYQLNGNSYNQKVEDLLGRLKKCAGNQCYLFAYNDLDSMYEKSWQALEARDYFEALSLAYDGMKVAGEFSDIYRQSWFPKVSLKLKEFVDLHSFSEALYKLEKYLHSNNIDQDKLVYIFQNLEGVVSEIKAEKRDEQDELKRIRYRLYNAGISVNCHMGKSREAIQSYNKCMDYAYYMSTDVLLSTQNKLSTSLADFMHFDEALKVADEQLSVQELLSDFRMDVVKRIPETAMHTEIVSDGNSLETAKAISQKGQILSFMRDPKAEDCFKEALGRMKKGSANYKITESYLLQYYLDNGMRDAYEETATDYFDGKTKPMDRYQYIITEGVKEQSIIGFRYALYVFVRGLYLFEMDQCNRAMKEKLLSIKKTAEKNKQNINIHPWEIIYKYLILIAVKLKDPTMEETFTRDYESLSLKEGATIEALMRFNRAEIAVAKGNIQERDKCLNDLKGFFLDKFDGYDEVQFSVSGDALFELFSKYFTYMYH